VVGIANVEDLLAVALQLTVLLADAFTIDLELLVGDIVDDTSIPVS
jgi:hypothetical protein